MNPEKPYALSLEKGDLQLPGGDLTSTNKASGVVNLIHAERVGQNQKEINVLVPTASHPQHVNHIKIKRPIVPPLMFTDDDLDGVKLPHNDPLVIALKVDDQPVDRFFVDQGSSVDIMYLNCFKKLDPKLKNLKPTTTVLSGFNEQEERPLGVVTLSIHAGSVTVQVDFLVVNAPSQCNAILGRPFLHKMRAVGSSYHQKLKFPTQKGIEEIQGNQVVSRMCSMVAVTPKVKAEKIVPVPDGCMGSDSGPMALLDFDKYVEETETDAIELEDVAGMGVTTAVEKEPFYRLIGAMNPEKAYALSLEKSDLHLPGGGLTSTYKASRVVNKVHAVGLDQNEEEINVLVPIASHLQHVNHIKIKRPIVPPIMFTDDDLDGVKLPHNDPLVIALKVDDQPVDGFFVDQGSSVDIMYLNCFEKLDPKLKNLKPTTTVLSGFNEREERPLGVVTLSIHAGSVTVQVDFLVVNAPSRYNAILGRPFLHKMRAVGSSYHQKLKFPTEKGIEEIRGNQVVSRMCSMVAVTRKIVPVPYGCMGSDSGPMALLDFDKYVEGETDANELEDVGGMGVTTAAEKVGASLELLEQKSLPEVPALDDA